MPTITKRRRGRRWRADPELEGRRAAELARRLELEVNRQRQISRPAMRAHDNRAKFMRCLIAFYGEKRVSGAPPCDERDLPRKLGQADEFAAEWARWQEIGREEREADTRARSAAAKRLSEFF